MPDPQTAAPAAPAYDIGFWRARIPILAHSIPMNNCSHAPQMEATRAAAEAYLDGWDRVGMDWDGWMTEVEAARSEFARLIHADAADVAVCASVSHATALVASALQYTEARGRVVVSEAEFPTVAHEWLAQRRLGADIAWVPVRDGVVPEEGYEATVDERTLLVSACAAYYQTGFRQDIAGLARLAHGAGALLYVDAYQALGAVDLDVAALGVDMLSSGALKFLLGVPGIAFLYVRPGLAERLEPTATGWFGREDPYAFDAKRLDWAPGARRFDTGTPPVVCAAIARAGMAVLNEIGPAAIEAWNTVLSRRLVEGGLARGLRPMGAPEPERKTATTAFHCGARDSHAVETALRARGLLASARGPAIRLAPHFYSTTEDVDRSLDAVAAVLEHGA